MEVDTLIVCNNDDVDSDGDVSADSWQRQDVIKHLALNAQPLAGTVYQQLCHQGLHHHRHHHHHHHHHPLVININIYIIIINVMPFLKGKGCDNYEEITMTIDPSPTAGQNCLSKALPSSSTS